MTMTNMDKVFAQNWIEQMRKDFVAYPFDGNVGRPLTYVYEEDPSILVNCFWWHRGSPYSWGRRDDTLQEEDFAR